MKVTIKGNSIAKSHPELAKINLPMELVFEDSGSKTVRMQMQSVSPPLKDHLFIIVEVEKDDLKRLGRSI